MKKIFVKKPGPRRAFSFSAHLAGDQPGETTVKVFDWCNSAAPETNSATPETMAAETPARLRRSTCPDRTRAFKDGNRNDATHFSASRRSLRVTLFR
jgi:hypothetical protein